MENNMQVQYEISLVQIELLYQRASNTIINSCMEPCNL